MSAKSHRAHAAATAGKRACAVLRCGRQRAIGRVAAPTVFGRALYAAISARGMSANAFAGVVGMTSGFISGVYSGLKRPPLDRVADWAKALRLKGPRRSAFMLLAHLEHASPLLRQTFGDCQTVVIRARDAGVPIGRLDVEALEQVMQEVGG